MRWNQNFFRQSFCTERLEARRLLSATLTVVASFNGANGSIPFAGVVIDSNGNLFGDTELGGDNNVGAVYEIATGSNQITLLSSFNSVNGAQPFGRLVLDSQGNLFGATDSGGSSQEGALFELRAGSNEITLLASFDSMTGADPYGGIVLDASGNIFGATQGGGAGQDGTIFELPAGANSITTLASFDASTGSDPLSPLTIDAQGNLYGTTASSGPGNLGTVFELPAGSDTIIVRGSFDSTIGGHPAGGVILDASGNLFGTTETSGSSGQFGTIFEVAAGTNTITTLAQFTGNNGATPMAGVVMDGSGNLFGTTESGGVTFDGNVYELPAGSNNVISLADFNQANGQFPSSDLVFDSQGNLYGTTQEGGDLGDGVVFKLSGAASGDAPVISQNNDVVTAVATTGDDTGAATVSGDVLTVTINSVTRTFPLAGVHTLNINLGTGSDTFRIGANVPPITVIGGLGSDTIVANNKSDLLNGGKGRDLIVSKKKNNTLHGGKGADTLSTSSTDNALSGGRGSDLFLNAAGSGCTVDGGVGLNFAQVNAADTLLNIFENYDPAPGQNPQVSSLIDTVAAVDVSIVGTNLLVTGTSGNDQINVASNGAGLLIVTNFGSGVGAVPLAGLGGVIIKGSTGNDSLTIDTAIALSATLRGGAGNDALSGGGANNVLVGGAGDDTLAGGPAGTSLLVPGARLIFAGAPSGSDSLIGGGGIAIADFSHRTDSLYLSNDGQPDSGDATAGEHTTIATSVSDLFGGDGNDTVAAGEAGMFLSGSGGNDTLRAAGAATIITGGFGGDTVNAGSAAGVALYLVDNQADSYTQTTSSDVLQLDPTLDV